MITAWSSKSIRRYRFRLSVLVLWWRHSCLHLTLSNLSAVTAVSSFHVYGVVSAFVSCVADGRWQSYNPDFVLRKVNFAFGNNYGSVVDHASYDYSELDLDYFNSHCVATRMLMRASLCTLFQEQQGLQDSS